MNDTNKIKVKLPEPRCEEVQEILGYIPRWIVRWGISLSGSIVLALFIGTWFLKYPDVILSQIVVSTQTPPASIVARVGGKIQRLYVEENQSVKQGAVIALIENSADENHVFSLKSQLKSWDGSVDMETLFVRFETHYALGELQVDYETFVKALQDYRNFRDLRYHRQKIDSFQEQINKQKTILERLDRQVKIQKQESDMAKDQYDRARELYKKNIISQIEFEKNKSTFLQKAAVLEQTQSSHTDRELIVLQHEQSIRDLNLEHQDQEAKMRMALHEAYQNLNGRISQWEYRYVLKSPLEGRVSFNKYWIVNQNVKEGESVFSVVPNDSDRMHGKLALPVQGAGKVKIGQKVNIKFFNYPFLEYGMVLGLVTSKSLVPADNAYLVEVELPKGLTTHYHKKLPFTQEMPGTAEIITEDIRLLQRIFQPIMAVIRK